MMMASVLVWRVVSWCPMVLILTAMYSKAALCSLLIVILIS